MVEDPRDQDEVEEDDEFRCQLCGDSFDSQQELEQHGQEEHESTDPDDKTA